MAFWIVYQGDSWKRARQGGYLWAPKKGEGPTPFHWTNMDLVEAGDLVFSGVSNAVRAVSQVARRAYTAERPEPDRDARWSNEGWRIDLTYTDLPTPLPYSDWVPAVLSQLPGRYSPFSATGRPNQGYLFALPNSAGEYLVELLTLRGLEVTAVANAEAPPPAGGETERETLARARMGQGKFRADLMKRWSGRCPLSGVDRPALLRASHIKPWASSNNNERLDPANGLLLSAAYDAAFDALLIGFSDDGDLVLAPDFSAAHAAAAGVDPQAKLPRPDDSARAYLREHRELISARIQRAHITSPPELNVA